MTVNKSQEVITDPPGCFLSICPTPCLHSLGAVPLPTSRCPHCAVRVYGVGVGAATEREALCSHSFFFFFLINLFIFVGIASLLLHAGFL